MQPKPKAETLEAAASKLPFLHPELRSALVNRLPGKVLFVADMLHPVHGLAV
jgi:hypothetical protein